MRKSDLKALLARPWDELRAIKDKHLAREGLETGFKIADSLRKDSTALRAELDPDARAKDLADLLHLKRQLERLSARRR